MLTDAQARDETFALFAAAWAGSGDTSGITLLYEDTNERRPDPTAGLVPYAYAWWKRVDSFEASLGGTDGRKVFTTIGIFGVQLFAPIGDGGTLLGKMGRVFQSALRRKRTAGGVVFRRVRVKEIGASGPWWYHDATAEFEFDEVM